jgi:hypothetical protein
MRKVLVSNIQAQQFPNEQAVVTAGNIGLISNLVVEQNTNLPFGSGGGEFDGVTDTGVTNKIALETIIVA